MLTSATLCSALLPALTVVLLAGTVRAEEVHKHYTGKVSLVA